MPYITQSIHSAEIQLLKSGVKNQASGMQIVSTNICGSLSGARYHDGMPPIQQVQVLKIPHY